MEKIKIFDTTLRDGEQSPGCSMDIEEKLEVARKLESLQVDIIEAGFAISSKGDFESVRSIADTIKNAKVASLARLVDKDILTAYDAVKTAAHPRIHTFIATSDLHMEYKLKMSRDQVLDRIAELIKLAKSKCDDIEFSAEDASRSDREFLLRAYKTAIENGATVINIPDTVGYATPMEMFSLVEYIKNGIPNADKVDISVHCHNDLGMGVANSLAAIQAGARQVECTVNGLGERAGNAALEEIVMALNTRKDYYKLETNIKTQKIYSTSRLVSSIIGQQPAPTKPIIGANAFAHESGIHQHGVMANKSTYEIMTPEDIGIPQNKMVLGKHSGRHAFEDRLNELGYTMTPEKITKLFERFKALADRKKTVTDDDIVALVGSKEQVITASQYNFVRFIATAGNTIPATAVVRLTKDGEETEEACMGDGPIDAAFNAINRMVNKELVMEDYQIRSITQGEDALGEVIVKLRNGGETVTGRGLSTDIIEASIRAYLNGINKLMSI